MDLNRADFRAFFSELHDGHEPFDWQERLLDRLLVDECWPDRIVAPTGAGKTAVIDVHVFALALTGDDQVVRLPRRLSLVVARRVLVDDQHEYARRLAGLLADPGSPVMRVVAERLWTLRRPADPDPTGSRASASPGGASPLVVGRLRGGQLPSRAWRDYPTAAAVLCATPDMWGSRLLFRGYGSSWKAWPREAGMLALDSAVVVDEAHLARQFLCTTRRVAQLATVAESNLGVPGLQVVETTATPADDGSSVFDRDLNSVGVEPDDLHAVGLADRLTKPKPVSVLSVADLSATTAAGRLKVATTMAMRVAELLHETDMARLHAHDDPSGVAHTVGCFVNTVSRAVDVTDALRRRKFADRPVRVVMICGQVRPHDLDRLRASYPGVLSPRGNHEVDVIVSTQSLEVGVDIDLAAMVTELASGTAVAQRVGRVNRRGLRSAGPITVVVPAEEITERTRSGPYDHSDLSAALVWVRRCEGIAEGMAPWTLRSVRPPAAQSRRILLQRPELAEAWHWARTSDPLAAEPELDLWLAEGFDPDTSVGIVVRSQMPHEPSDALRLIKDLPPRSHEVFPVPYVTAVSALRRWGVESRRGDDPRPLTTPTSVVLRGEEVTVLGWRPPREDEIGERPAVKPGDVVVVDESVSLFTSSAAASTGGFSPPVVLGGITDSGLTAVPADDVLTALADLPDALWAARREGNVVLRLEHASLRGGRPTAFADLAEALAGLDEPGNEWQDAQARRVVVGAWLTRSGLASESVMAQAASELLASGGRCELMVHSYPPGDLDDTDAAPGVARVLVIDRRRAPIDEGLRQVWTPATHAVTLDAHQQAVAERALLLATSLGLSSGAAQALELAGAHHDDGKRDERFQARLGRRGDVVLAKSRPGISSLQARRNEARSELPVGWRHEQRSVVESWGQVRASGVADPALAARLIGTSHGHGRAGFPHLAKEMLRFGDDDEVWSNAEALFDSGAWDELIERTQERYGVWGCAYLEALLRAADGQVSEEGS